METLVKSTPGSIDDDDLLAVNSDCLLLTARLIVLRICSRAFPAEDFKSKGESTASSGLRSM